METEGSKMLILKLAYRNLVGARLRTWLNVGILSFAYVLIIGHQGLFTGMLKEGSQAMISDEIAGGQYWYKNYDPFDPISLDESHGVIPYQLEALIQRGEAAPILIRQASIYPEGRAQSVLLKGIEPGQTILSIPSAELEIEEDILPIFVGNRMAKSNSLAIGDYITVRWRDAKGTFDAAEGKIVAIMNTKASIGNGQLWIPLKELQKMTRLDNEATMVVVGRSVSRQTDLPDWKFRDQDFLLSDITAMVRSKRVSSGIMYAILLFLVMLAIFDTQVLAVFRRRKEIGTLMALGLTRLRVIMLFTLEGALNGILAAIAAAIYGTPLLILFAKYGMAMPEAADSYGYALASRILPSYSVRLVLGTAIIVMATVTIVSYLPTRRISKMEPTEALRGKIS
jgi:ABC-type lipoprotein release transport system permease subunit